MPTSSDRCWYCLTEHPLSSPEHVIGRALGGGLVIPVCPPCNVQANEQVDRPLAALDDIRRTRARLGLRDPRTNEPYTFEETFDSTNGMRWRARWSKDGVDARVLPIEIPRPGTIVSDLFIDPRDADEYARKQSERAAKRGETVGPPLSADEWARAPEPRYRAGEEITVVLHGAGRRIPAWVWPAATAKIVLGCLCDGAQVGSWPSKTIDALVVHALRMLAFDHLYSPDVWTPADIWTRPRRPAASHELAGAIAADEHLVAIYDGNPPLAQVVLFGCMLLKLPLPGLDVVSPRAWLLSTHDRSVVADSPDLIAGELKRRRRALRQLALL